MAKRRGVVSPLGNTVGAQEAEQNAAKANIDSLTKQLTAALAKDNGQLSQYLAEKLGISSPASSYSWKLASGAVVVFSEVTLSLEQVKAMTIVSFEINGRDQSFLNEQSLSDLNSMAAQQYYPAVGYEVDGKIDVLDGSRRRAWFLNNAKPEDRFRVLVSKEKISLSDAKSLARQLQSAKEHSLREIGLQCLELKKENPEIKQSEIADVLGMSQSGVSKALKAAQVHVDLVRLFPDLSELGHADYTFLNSVEQSFSDDELGAFIELVSEQSCNIQAEYSGSDYKEAMIALMKDVLKSGQDKPKNPAKVTKLAEFSQKQAFARKRVKGRDFSYEFRQVPKALQKELDAAIAEVLKKHEG